jgi:hypothetical protein
LPPLFWHPRSQLNSVVWKQRCREIPSLSLDVSPELRVFSGSQLSNRMASSYGVYNQTGLIATIGGTVGLKRDWRWC